MSVTSIPSRTVPPSSLLTGVLGPAAPCVVSPRRVLPMPAPMASPGFRVPFAFAGDIPGAGAPPIDPRETALEKELSAHIHTTFVGVREARFQKNEYAPSYEPVLRRMGVDMIVIEFPSAFDKEILKNVPDFFRKPEKIHWRRKVESEESYLDSLTSHQKHKIKSALKKAEGIKVESAPLTAADFEQWYPLYEREVVGKERGRRVIEAGWARSKSSLEEYRKIFFRDPDTNELIGGALIKMHRREGRCTIAYAAYDHRFRDRGLSVKTFLVAMEHARKEGYHQISYGIDSNLYGHHLNLGLMEYKASLGFMPSHGQGEELVKVLNPERLQKEHFFFSYGSDGKLEGQYFSDAPRNLVSPLGTPIVKHPRFSTASDVTTMSAVSALELVERVHTMEQADQLEKLFLELYPPGESHFLQDKLSKKGEIDPKCKTMTILQVLRTGHGSVNFFLQMVHARALLADKTSYGIIHFSDLIRQDPQFIGRVASTLGNQFDISFWQPALVEIVQEQFGDLQTIQKAYPYDSSRMIADVLRQVNDLHGVAGLIRLLNGLHALFDLRDAIRDTEIIPVVEKANRGHLTLHDLDLTKYFSPENLDRAGQLLTELYETLQLAQIWWIYDGNITSAQGVLTETVGGKFTGLVLDYLNCPAHDRAWLTRADTWPSYGAGRRIPQILASLYEMIQPDQQSTIDPVKHRFSTLLGELYRRDNQILELLVNSEIRPDTVKIWGRSPKDIFEEIYDRASQPQLSAIIAQGLKTYGGSREVKDLASSVRSLSKEDSRQPLDRLELNREELEHAQDALSMIIFQAKKWGEFLPAICASLQVEVPSSESMSARSAAVAIILQCLHRGQIPDLSQKSFFGVLLTYAQTHHDLGPALEWLSFHPKDQPSQVELITMLDSFAVWEDDKGYLEYPELLFILMALSLGEEVSQRAQAALDRIPDRTVLSGNKEDAQKVEDQMRQVPEEKRERLAGAIAGLMRRIARNNNHRSNFDFLFAFTAYRGLGQPLAPLWNIIDELAAIHPSDVIAMSGSRDWYPSTDQPRMNQAVYKALEHAEEVKGMNDSYLSWYRDRIGKFNNIPWPSSGFASLNRPILYFAHHTASRGLFPNDTPILDIIGRVFYQPSEKIGEIHVLAAQLLPHLQELPAYICYFMLEKLEGSPFESPEILSQLSEVFEQVDPLGQHHLHEAVYANHSFFKTHPWQAYGYSEDVIQKVCTFAGQADFSAKQARLLAHLLLSHNGKLFNRIWISQLILSTPDQGLHTLMRFLQFWESISQKNKDEYLARRVDDLLADTRLKAAREALGDGFDKIVKKIATHNGSGQQVSAGLLAKRDTLATYRVLFGEYAEADEARQRELLTQINEQILKDWPPRIRPDEEKALLIQNRYDDFLQRLNLTGLQRERFLSSLRRHDEVLYSSGILDRFIQFASFADPQGMERLQQVIVAYTNDQTTRVVEVERPDLNGQKTSHFDYFEKFGKLEKELLRRGVEPSSVTSFMNQWKQLWRFQNVGENQYVSITHDLERWCKHAEEPALSCQRISSKSGNMGPSNWNYQFGPNPNASGRPLARMLLPQLKLAEYREKGKVLARSVLEVTVQVKDGKPVLSLLVESVYADHKLTLDQRSQLITSIYQYAGQLGIAHEDIYLADKKEHLESAPSPLPEEYRIYRDRFRPTS